MQVICNNDANEGGIQVWSWVDVQSLQGKALISFFTPSQIKIDSIFNNYRIQSNSNNEITVNLTCEALMGALRSVSTSSGTSNSASGSSYETDEVIIKLAKKNDQAVLNFEITGTTRVGRKVRIGHDVKIEVMKPADVVKLSEPMCPEPDVCFFPFHSQKVNKPMPTDTCSAAVSTKNTNNRRTVTVNVRCISHPRQPKRMFATFHQHREC